jgi:hypothetical protein
LPYLTYLPRIAFVLTVLIYGCPCRFTSGFIQTIVCNIADKMGYYNAGDFDKQRKEPGKESNIPPQANLLAAASHVRQLFENKKLTYGIMGGLEMLCLGRRREMPDLHIAYDDKDFNRIRAKLEANQRYARLVLAHCRSPTDTHSVRLPEGMNPLFPSRILVQTGPAYHDTGCKGPATIEVNLVPSGQFLSRLMNDFAK